MAEIVNNEVMYTLFNQLWLNAENGTSAIKDINNILAEVCKSTGISDGEARELVNTLIDKDLIALASIEPILFTFADKAQHIKSASDLNTVLTENQGDDLS